MDPNPWTQVFTDDFSNDAPDVNRDIWTTPEWHAAFPHWGPWNPGYFGRTAVRNPNPQAWGANGQVPVKDGCAQLYLGKYNKFDIGKSFLGSQIGTRAFFGGTGIEAVKFEARMKIPEKMPAGAVMALFAYGLLDVSLNPPHRCTNGCRDELDFEIASKHIYAAAGSQQVNTNVYVDSGDPSSRDEVVTLNNQLDVTKLNTYSIVWAADKIEWYINDSSTPIRTLSGVGNSPTHGMALLVNFWVPNADWGWAYSDDLKPSTNPGDLDNWVLQVDQASVYYQYSADRNG